MKSPYIRHTREVLLSEVPDPLQQSLQKRAEERQLQLAGVRCWLTRSENPPATGFFGRLLGRRANGVDPDPWHLTLVVLHATHILVSTHGEHRGTSTQIAPLLQISLQDTMRIGKGAAPTRLDGISLQGFASSLHGQTGSVFVGLGEEPAAAACRATIERAVRAVKNPG